MRECACVYEYACVGVYVQVCMCTSMCMRLPLLITDNKGAQASAMLVAGYTGVYGVTMVLSGQYPAVAPMVRFSRYVCGVSGKWWRVCCVV
jgi:hypothetical protein